MRHLQEYESLHRNNQWLATEAVAQKRNKRAREKGAYLGRLKVLRARDLDLNFRWGLRPRVPIRVHVPND